VTLVGENEEKANTIQTPSFYSSTITQTNCKRTSLQYL